MKDKFIKLYMKWANDVASLSHCARARYGVILTSLDGERVLAFGYNGTWRDGPNTCTGPNKPGLCECIHAEANALIKPRSQEPFIVFITGEPCLNCAKLLINSLQCKQVYAIKNGYRSKEGLKLLRQKMKVVLMNSI